MRKMKVYRGCLFVLLYLISVSEAVVYTNSWTLQLNGPPKSTATKYGFVYLGQVFSDGDYYHMKQRAVPKHSFQPHLHNQRLKWDSKVLWFEQQSLKIHSRRDPPTKTNTPPRTPTDPLFPKQWHLSNTLEQNVMAAWARGYTGDGVVVSVLDDGLESNHPDIIKNYDPQASYDMNDNDSDPIPRYTKTNENRHGTRCAGEIAASANNNLCGAGIAYKARIGGRMLDGYVTDLLEAMSLSFSPHYIDIYVASWGPADNGRTVDGPNVLAREAFLRGVSFGRKGFGSVYVWAAGNGGNSLDNCNCDGYANSIYTVTVGSATAMGTVPLYSEPCSAILTTTYSGGSPPHRNIVTTDLHGSCTSDHTGTSASAPLAAGIIALALEANPTLTWRDVQHIVIRASRPAGLQSKDWRPNGAGRLVSHFFGYGLLDADRLVELARKWRSVQSQKKCISAVITRPRSVLDGKLTLQWNEAACEGSGSWIRSLEHVRLRLTLTNARRGDLTVSLTSPMGTISKLLTVRPLDWSSAGFHDWAFVSIQYWDEDPSGYWVLHIESTNNLSRSGVLSQVQMELYGTEEHMIHRRLLRDTVQNCEVKDQHGACEVCAYPWLKYDKFCVVSCPPHHYKEENSSHPSRKCVSCHHTCSTCYGPLNTQCLSCPPYSTPDHNEGTCSKTKFPWEKNSQQVEMWQPMALIGVSLVILMLCISAGFFTNRLLRVSETNVRPQTEAEVLEMVEINGV